MTQQEKGPLTGASNYVAMVGHSDMPSHPRDGALHISALLIGEFITSEFLPILHEVESGVNRFPPQLMFSLVRKCHQNASIMELISAWLMALENHGTPSGVVRPTSVSAIASKNSR